MRLTKSDILELYLNRVYLGSGAYGIDAAARRYFRKPARNLTLGEAAMIAGLLKAPSKYSPLSNPGIARARARIVLSQMQEAGFITEDEERKAADEVSRSFDHSERAGAGRCRLRRRLRHGAAGAGLRDGRRRRCRRAHRRDDARPQRAGERFGRSSSGSSPRAARRCATSEAAAVVLDRDGALLALVGGRSYAETQFNRAVKAARQPGSAFKPFVYLAALEAGYTPDSVVEDLPVSVGGWAPRNDNGEYLGQMPMRTALAKSVNAVAARLTLQVGPARVAQAAKRLGIRSPAGQGRNASRSAPRRSRCWS